MTDYWVVTHYGCNSSANSMRVPKIRLFKDETLAMEYYENLKKSITSFNIVCESFELEDGQAVQNQAGYLDGMTPGNYAKRPEGVVIRRVTLD